ncbi:MAG: NGG1p interacting factor NIF3, partial [Candidatus Thermoplasmatota archaeon]|nr:NGG1p interacting factor NIF3 [Candidatus Thermoplasmatota archaeon]
ILDKAKKQHEKMSDDDRWEFDQEQLWNPYGDSRMLHLGQDPEVKRVLMGVNIDSAEILLADRLCEKGEKIDLVIGHHPRGTAQPGLPEVMDIQVDFFERWGIPPNVGDQLMDPRIKEVLRNIMPGNHQQAVDTARLLDVPFMNTHSPADIMVHNEVQKYLDDTNPYTVGDICAALKKLPEYRTAVKLKNGPRVVVGSKDGRCGKVVVKFAGGTGAPKTVYEAMERAGVGTAVFMHIGEDHIELAKKHHINVVVAGHMPSDSRGMNLLYKPLEETGKLEIVRMSGLIGPG